jgi:hypothetical protein
VYFRCESKYFVKKFKVVLPYCFLILLLLGFFSVNGQVLNIDREHRDDSLLHKWDYALGASLSSDKQKRNLLESSVNVEVARNLSSKYSLIGIVRNELEYNGPTQIQNEGLVHFRYRDRDTRKNSLEIFLQSIWNGQWGLEYRHSGGALYRIRLIEKRGIDMYMGLGLFHEWEQWNWSGVRPELVPAVATNIYNQSWRLNQYLKFSAQASKWVDFSLISYLQPGFAESTSPRWYLDGNTYFKAGEKFSLVLHWDHIIDKQVAVPISNFFYGFSFGIQYGRRE